MRNLRGSAVSAHGSAALHRYMLGLWLHDLESLEAISQNDDARKIFLKMASLSHNGQLGTFLVELRDDREIDDATKDSLTELAQDRSFLLAVEEYLRRTHQFH